MQLARAARSKQQEEKEDADEDWDEDEDEDMEDMDVMQARQAASDVHGLVAQGGGIERRETGKEDENTRRTWTTCTAGSERRRRP